MSVFGCRQDFFIYLASKSPRRRELLAQIGLRYELVAAEVDETAHAGESPVAYVARVAADKAVAGERMLAAADCVVAPVLGADTAVVCEGRIMGKPRDREHAFEMLRHLSGRSHAVYSAFCVRHQGRSYADMSVTEVRFAPLDEDMIAAYWETGEPLGKAGAYAIQGQAAAFVASIEGSYSGVVGLPLFELVEALRPIMRQTDDVMSQAVP